HPPIIFRIRGQNFETNAAITNWPAKSVQNLTSPTGTLASAVAALNANDVEWYSSLLDPEEKTNAVRYGWDTNLGRPWDALMREQFKLESSQTRPSAIRLDKQIVYSDGVAALIYEDASCKPGERKDILYFRRTGTNWYISHKMEERGVQLTDYFGFGTTMHTKIFPHFDPVQPSK
ncbi:MAG TPA: hypothetical protein VK810_01975, partial [Dongiaceae bacterium]|nr:hypothetical protein [Dongiaceae bacterium]